MRLIVIGFTFSICVSTSIAQQSDTSVVRQSSVVGNNAFTTGLLMSRGKVEVKTFNNLFTQVQPCSGCLDKRSSFFTSFIQFTFGSRYNLTYGIDFLYKSNVVNDLSSNSALAVFNFDKKSETNFNDGMQFTTDYDHGLSHIGARVRTRLFKKLPFTFQQAVYVPSGSIDEGWIINTDLFYEHIIANGRVMLFGDLGVWYNTRQRPFPYLKAFAGTMLFKKLGPYVMLNLPYEIGAGLKIFILRYVELEFLYTWWLPLELTIQDRKSQTFNLGIRFTNFNNNVSS